MIDWIEFPHNVSWYIMVYYSVSNIEVFYTYFEYFEIETFILYFCVSSDYTRQT